MNDDVKVLDVHGHVSMPLGAMAWLTMLLGSNTALDSPFAANPDGIVNPAQGGVAEAEFHAATARHIAYIDERQIDVQLIGPRPFIMFGWMAEHLIPAAALYVNDVIHQQVMTEPSRFVGACQLPQLAHAEDTTHCLAELNRCVGDLGFGAAYVSPDPEGRRTSPGLDDSYWRPLYQRCVELDVPIVVHGSNMIDPRIANIPHNYQIGFIVEQYIATQLLSHGDVFDRYPDLRVIVCHCGGALDRFIPSDPHLSQRDLSANLFFDTCAHDVIYLEAAIKQRTPTRMVFGSEAPGSGGARRPETGRTADDLVPVIKSLEFLTDEEKVGIFNTNPARVVPALGRI
jgi:predicted TIM-barrel fold metal-dependent hydrolase